MRRLVLLLLALSLVFPATAREGIVGRDDRRSEDPEAWPLTAVGRLNLGPGGFCSATLVGPDLVLAAGHCMPKPKPGETGPRPSLLYFLAGYAKGRFKGAGQGNEIVTGRSHPTPQPAGLSGGNMSPFFDDWALIRVTSHTNDLDRVTPAKVFSGDLKSLVGKTVMLAGYHHDRPSFLSVQRNCRILGVIPETPIFIHDCDLLGRASGSPIFYGDGDDARLIGIALAYAKQPDGTIFGIGRIPPEFTP